MKLTAASPEPPPGTVVLDDCGDRWERSYESGWLRTGYEDGDPESWVKVAGNYGPVTVIELGDDDSA